MVIAIAAEKNVEYLQLDVRTMFLDAKIERETYVASNGRRTSQTPGFETTGGAPQVMKLLKRPADKNTERCKKRTDYAWHKYRSYSSVFEASATYARL